MPLPLRRCLVSMALCLFLAIPIASANEIRSDGKPGAPCNLGQTTRKQRDAMAAQDAIAMQRIYIVTGVSVVLIAAGTLAARRWLCSKSASPIDRIAS